MHFIFYFIIFNAVLGLFTTIGVYSTASQMQAVQDWEAYGNTDLSNPVQIISGIGFKDIGIGTLVGAISIGVSILSGISPMIAVAYGAMTGLFAGMWVSMFGWFDNLINWSKASCPDCVQSLDWAKLLLATIFILMFVYGLIQMATGGGKAQE